MSIRRNETSLRYFTLFLLYFTLPNLLLTLSLQECEYIKKVFTASGNNVLLPTVEAFYCFLPFSSISRSSFIFKLILSNFVVRNLAIVCFLLSKLLSQFTSLNLSNTSLAVRNPQICVVCLAVSVGLTDARTPVLFLSKMSCSLAVLPASLGLLPSTTFHSSSVCNI